MSVEKILRAVFKEVIVELKTNPQFAKRIEGALGDRLRTQRAKTNRANRRSRPVIDPYESYTTSEEKLREALAPLHEEQLKDVIAEYGMDQARLAMKWKSRDRLVEHIVTTVSTRARKGDAFKGS